QGEAGIWAPSGESVDGSGNVYVETGNGSYGSSTPCDNTKWDHGDAVIKLSPALAQLSFFAPSNWCALNASDHDLGSIAPSLLSSGEVFATGKSGDGWLLNSSSLGGFAGQQFAAHVDSCPSSDAVFGGNAYDGSRIFVPCDTTG